MKFSIYTKQSLLQIILYFVLYEITLKLIKNLQLIKFELSTGISSYYMFYSFVFLSIFFGILLFFTKKNTLLILSVEFLILIALSIYLYGFVNISIYMIWIILFLSIFGSYLLLFFKNNF